MAARAVVSSPTCTLGVDVAGTRDAAIDGVGRPAATGGAVSVAASTPFAPVVIAAIHFPLSFEARALKTLSPLRYWNSAGAPSSSRRAASGGAISRRRPSSCEAPSVCLVSGTEAPSLTSEASSFSTSRSDSARLLTITESSRSNCGIWLR